MSRWAHHGGNNLRLSPIMYRGPLSQVSIIETLRLDDNSRRKRPVLVTMTCIVYGTIGTRHKVFEVNELGRLSTHEYYAYLVHNHCPTTYRTHISICPRATSFPRSLRTSLSHFISAQEPHHFLDHLAHKGSSLPYVAYDSCLLHFTCLTLLFGLNRRLIPHR